MPNPQQVVELLRLEGKNVEIRTPGELVEDVDGIPHSVGQPVATSEMIGSVHLTATEWEETARYLLRMLDIKTEYANGFKKLFNEMLTINKKAEAE